MNLRDYIRGIPDFPKPGILFYDITPLLAAPEAFRRAVVDMANPFRREKIDVVAAAEARGFIFAAPVALELNASLGWFRSASPASCLSRRNRFPTTWNMARTRWKSTPTPSPPGPRSWSSMICWPPEERWGPVVGWFEQVGGQVVGCSFLIELSGLGGAKQIAQYRTSSLIRLE